MTSTHIPGTKLDNILESYCSDANSSVIMYITDNEEHSAEHYELITSLKWSSLRLVTEGISRGRVVQKVKLESTGHGPWRI